MFQKIGTFVSQTKTELQKVTWPSRKEVVSSCVIVLAVTAFLALFIGFFDFIFSTAIRLLLH